ncbi:MAG: B12-binding domain-containing radical SAM protein, partial [Synergistaceae bacterium]|nr:B12-binding domain-containing radical SAM protein [Synergistaceae bacterium]
VGDKGVRGDERCDAADKGVHGDERGVGDTGVHGDERGVGVGDGCSVLEFTINDRYDAVLAAIVHENADILAFSCYIWNIGVVLRLIVDLKSIDNRYVIILGGPEISFSAREILAENSGVDFIISGEGENVLPVLISAVKTGQKDFRGIESVSFRDRRTNEIVISDRFNLVEDLDTIPTPFRQAGYGALHCVRSRIVYYEASRGCPYSCSYCMSSAFEGVRFFSFERVKNDLRTIVESGARLVKFVDRTFNCDKKRVVQVLRFIKQFRGTTFHFEMVPELFDSEMIDEIAGFEKGGLQFEIGVQSTNSAALESVSRRFNRVEAFDNITRLLALGNVHIHLGLIAGLPYETFESFAQTFDTVHRLRAHQMQCGFLKLLRGSAIRKNAGMYGFAYQYQAPYEILKNNFISYQDLCIIKSVERMLDSLYNSAAFKFSLIYATEIIFDSPFAFYRAVSSYAEDRGIDALTNIGRREYYSILSSFCLDEFPSHAGIFKILLLLDFYCSGIRADVPANIYERHDFKAHEFLRKLTLRGVDFPSGLAGKKISEISKKAKFALMPVRLELAALESGRFTEYVLKKREELRLMGEQAIDCKWAYLFDLTAKDPVTGRHSFYSYPFEK